MSAGRRTVKGAIMFLDIVLTDSRGEMEAGLCFSLRER